MNDVYVQMLLDARNKQNLSTTVLCEGLYTEDMFYLVESGRRHMDRGTAKHLLERAGVDNGNYEHYLDYPDYEEWKRRMRIINCIEDDCLDEAKSLLNEYKSYDDFQTNQIRQKIKKQFCIFMEIQVMKHRGNMRNDIDMYEEALKLTVPNIDKKPLKKLLLSPIEFILALEYKSRKYADTTMSVEDKLRMYEEFFNYIEDSPFGKISSVKVYSKLVETMYRDIQAVLTLESKKDNSLIYEKLLGYCEEALRQIKDRKLMYYLTEMLEIRLELMLWLGKNNNYPPGMDQCSRLTGETSVQLEELKKLYEEYSIPAYMADDCYLYRESGIYCINEVIKTRRKMMGLTREELSDEDVAASTVWRIETGKKPVSRRSVEKLFDRLKLFPSCVNIGIITDKKEGVELYEELRYAAVSFENHKVTELLENLRNILPEHPINQQILMRIESLNKLRLGEKSREEHIETLKRALECTVKLSDIQRAESIFITTEELNSLYQISVMYKETEKSEEALEYIKEIHEYCRDMEKQSLADGRMGIYELVMAHVASLYGDIGKYQESNDISERLIKLGLKLRRSNRIHTNMYNIAWNNDDAKVRGYDYNSQVQRCIYISQILGDTYDEKFYRENLKT